MTTVATLERRVYFQDTDAGGVAHHSSYVRWFEQGRSEWMHKHGLSISTWARHKIMFVVARLELDYRRPLRVDDSIVIATWVETEHRSGVTFALKISRHTELVCTGRARMVCVNTTSGRACAVPAELRLPESG